MFHNLLGLLNSLGDPHYIWKSPSLDWISLFMKLNKSILNFELKILRIKYLFRRPSRLKNLSVSEPNRIITVLRRPSIQLKKSFTRLKIAFDETAQEYFLSSKFDNVLSNFFVDLQDGKISLFQNLLELSNSLEDPLFIWESPSLDWISLFIKMHKSILIFELKIWRVNYFFRRTLDGKLALFHILLGLSNSLVDPHFNWESPSLDWTSLFMKLHKSIFWARNLTTC